MTTQKNTALQPAPHIGNLLQDYFAKKRIRKNAMARALGRHISTLVKFLKNDTIQANALWDICLILKHNFFQDIAASYPPISLPMPRLTYRRHNVLLSLNLRCRF